MNHADKMLHLVSVKNITEPVYYLLELHFDASKSPLYEARHPSRGGAVYVSIDQRASCYEDLYKVASNEKIKDVNNKNFCIYGIFNGFYDFKGGRPFNIHSPYEYIK